MDAARTDTHGAAQSAPVPCAHCTGGTVTRQLGPLWWQRTNTRCAYCGGTGRVRDEFAWLRETEESSCPTCGAGEHEQDRCAERST
jgi:DnaJ-class molecular chaperone